MQRAIETEMSEQSMSRVHGAVVAERRNDSHIVMIIIITLLWKVKKLGQRGLE